MCTAKKGCSSRMKEPGYPFSGACMATMGWGLRILSFESIHRTSIVVLSISRLSEPCCDHELLFLSKARSRLYSQNRIISSGIYIFSLAAHVSPSFLPPPTILTPLSSKRDFCICKKQHAWPSRDRSAYYFRVSTSHHARLLSTAYIFMPVPKCTSVVCWYNRRV